MRTGAQLQELEIRLEWTVGKLIPEGAITLIHGPAGLGKTWLCLAIANAVADGVPFLGLPTKKSEVVYIDFENPLPVEQHRARALNIRTVHFWHISDRVRPPKLDSPEWQKLKKLHPKSLIIIDTARGATDGDDNSSKDVALVMNRLKELREGDHTIIIQAHTSKANKKVSKGATTWEDLADHVVAFYRVKPGTLEEIEGAGHDPNALLYLGTGNKTRYEPCRYYVGLDAATGTFRLADEQKWDSLDKLASYISGAGSGKNQSRIIEWAMKNRIGSSNRDKISGMLVRGEKEGRWHSEMVGRSKVYTKST